MNYAYVHPKDNEIYWSPVPKPEFNAWRDSEEIEQEALKAFEDGLTVKYEDQRKARELATGFKFDEDSGYWFNADHTEMTGQPELKPGTCVPIDVKGMRIWQRKENGIWIDDTKDISNLSNLMYREVFRITK